MTTKKNPEDSVCVCVCVPTFRLPMLLMSVFVLCLNGISFVVTYNGFNFTMGCLTEITTNSPWREKQNNEKSSNSFLFCSTCVRADVQDVRPVKSFQSLHQGDVFTKYEKLGPQKCQQALHISILGQPNPRFLVIFGAKLQPARLAGRYW